MNDGPYRDEKGHFLPRPKETKPAPVADPAPNRVWLAVAAILIMGSLIILGVLFALHDGGLHAKLKAAQAEVERLKAEQKAHALQVGECTPVAGVGYVCGGGSTASSGELGVTQGTCTGCGNPKAGHDSGYLGKQPQPKPPAKRAELPTNPYQECILATRGLMFDQHGYIRPIPNLASPPSIESCDSLKGQPDWDTPAVAMPFDPEEERRGNTGPMMLQNSRGEWHPWHSEQVPRKIQ